MMIELNTHSLNTLAQQTTNNNKLKLVSCRSIVTKLPFVGSLTFTVASAFEGHCVIYEQQLLSELRIILKMDEKFLSLYWLYFDSSFKSSSSSSALRDESW